MKKFFEKKKKQTKKYDMAKILERMIWVSFIVFIISFVVVTAVRVGGYNNLLAVWICGWLFVPIMFISAITLALTLIAKYVAVGKKNKAKDEIIDSGVKCSIGIIILLSVMFCVIAISEKRYSNNTVAIQTIEKEVKNRNKDYKYLVDFEDSPYSAEITKTILYIKDKYKVGGTIRYEQMKNLVVEKTIDILSKSIKEDINKQEFIEYAKLKEKYDKEKEDSKRYNELKGKYSKKICNCTTCGSSCCCTTKCN